MLKINFSMQNFHLSLS